MDKVVYGHAGVPLQTEDLLAHHRKLQQSTQGNANQCLNQGSQCVNSSGCGSALFPGESAYGVGNQTQAAARPFTVWDLVQHAHDRLDALQGRVGALDERLQTVLAPSSPDAQGNEGTAQSLEPQAVLLLRSLIMRIDATAERVADINARVRV